MHGQQNIKKNWLMCVCVCVCLCDIYDSELALELKSKVLNLSPGLSRVCYIFHAVGETSYLHDRP